MTTVFDQFEEPSQNLRGDIVNIAEMSTLGYIQMKAEPDTPIFQQRIRKDFVFDDKVTHMAVANKYLIVVMANNGGKLLRINLNNRNQDEISLSKYTTTCQLTNVFLDPTGNHLLLTFAPRTSRDSTELLYLSQKSTKLKGTSKFRGHEITAIGWNNSRHLESTTGPLLLGTTKGIIFETEIALEGEKFFTSGLEQYWRQVFDIGKGKNVPITGLVFGQVDTEKFFIFVTTSNRLYFFKGKVNADEKPLLQQVFNRYLNVLEENTFFEVKGESQHSKLKFWSENIGDTIKNVAWMTHKGILLAHTDVFINDNERTVKQIVDDTTQIINYPMSNYTESSSHLPINFVLTEFHILLAYTDMIKGISILNKELVYEDSYNEAFGKLINIMRDSITCNIWAITERHLFKYIVTREDRFVWQFYCDRQQFNLAKEYSRDNEIHHNQVLIKEADMLFNMGQYAASAKCYAGTRSRFEDVCLKFIQADNLDALKIFLCEKLKNLQPHDKTQITMLVLWIIELYLDRLEDMRLKGMEYRNEYNELQKEFESFLATKIVSTSVKSNKSTIYNLMASHGDKKNLMKLTIINKDFEQLIKQHIYNGDYREALDVLGGQDNKDLYYQFTQILLQEIPAHTVKALIDQGRYLAPLKLLPALVSCRSKEVIKYLEFCTEKLDSKEKAIHNLLLTLYAEYEPDKLMKYLEAEGQEASLVKYDVYFALRLCQEKKLHNACVHLSALLGLWESAVDLALTISQDLAKKIANLPPPNDVELKKKLWLKIAKHVISGKDDIAEAMSFLRECELLRIEDILPYFSDFVTIDHFRNAICDSLKEYNQQIQDLKEEMAEATKSADVVRKEIQSFRNRCTVISNRDVCDICELTLMIRPFYVFPCRHMFHGDCLLKELSPLLGPARKNKLADLHRQLNKLSNQNVDNVSTGSSGMSARDTVKAEIDNIVASECLYCGEYMIRNIDLPFINDDDYDKIMKEWM